MGIIKCVTYRRFEFIPGIHTGNTFAAGRISWLYDNWIIKTIGISESIFNSTIAASLGDIEAMFSKKCSESVFILKYLYTLEWTK